MKKLLILVLFMLAIPSANGLETNFDVINNTFYPGEEKVIGTLEINTNTSIKDIMIWSDIIFHEQFEMIQIDELNNESYQINLSASVPNFYPANIIFNNIYVFFTNVQNVNYSITFFNETTNQTENLTIQYQEFTPEMVTTSFNITVLESKRVEVQEQIDLIVRNNETVEIQIPVYNSGNKKLNLNLFSDELKLNQNMTLFPNQNVSVVFDYLVPLDLQPTNHIFLINITDNGLQTGVNLTLFVFDNIKPDINITFDENISYGEIQYIRIILEDNIDIDYFHTEIYEPGGNITKFINQTEINYNETKQKGDYEINVFANDSSGNAITIIEIFNVSGLKAITIKEKDIDFEKVRTDMKKLKFALNVEHTVDTMIILKNLTGLESIKLDITGAEVIELKNNENITIDNGEVYIVVQSNIETEFSGILEIQTEDYVDLKTDEIKFHGEIVDYAPPQSYNTLLFGSYPMNCSANNPNNLEKCFYGCYTEYPCSLDLVSLTVPIAPMWITEMKDNYDDQIKEKDDALFLSAIVTWFFIIIAVLLVISIYYSHYIYPTLRRRAKW